jgi:hypothetical protein
MWWYKHEKVMPEAWRNKITLKSRNEILETIKCNTELLNISTIQNKKLIIALQIPELPRRFSFSDQIFIKHCHS